MRSLIVGIVLALALPNAALAKGKHKKARAHASKKIKQSKHAKASRTAKFAKQQELMPVSTVTPAAAAEPEPAPAPEPKAPAASASLEPVLGHKAAPVTPHEASNLATQATDNEEPGKKR
jgi:hypothetical protein